MRMVIRTLADLPQAAEHLLKKTQGSKVLLFYGPMGVGKTTLIKTLCQQLGVEENTSSPTFSIVNEYHSPVGPVYHFDFYRLNSEREAFDLGYEEYFYSGNYCLVEWPEKIKSLLPPDAISIHLEPGDDQQRILQIS